MLIIKNKSIVEDDWFVLRLNEGEAAATVAVAEGRVIVPLAVWLAQRDTLQGRAELGVWLGSTDRPEALAEDIARFAVIAVEFPKFADGRGYTIAYLLRERLGYQGELRAIGDVLRDQVFLMRRVGFDAFVPREGKEISSVIKGLDDFSESYQASGDQAQPLFRRVARGVA